MVLTEKLLNEIAVAAKEYDAEGDMTKRYALVARIYKLTKGLSDGQLQQVVKRLRRIPQMGYK